MTLQKRLTGILMTVRPHAFRLVYCVFIFSFLLPYVDIVGCSTKKIVTYHGYQLIKGTPAMLYLLTIAMFIAMLVLSFYKKEVTLSLRAFAASWRAMAAALAGFIIGFLPGIQFLFDGVFMLIGQLLGLVCAVIVFMDGIVISIRDFIVLRRGSPAAAGGGKALPPFLAKLHISAIIISLVLVPVYAFSLHDEIMVAVLYFLCLSLPFVLSQAIVVQGVRRGERWTLRWAPAVSLLLAGAAVMTILSLT